MHFVLRLFPIFSLCQEREKQKQELKEKKAKKDEDKKDGKKSANQKAGNISGRCHGGISTPGFNAAQSMMGAGGMMGMPFNPAMMMMGEIVYKRHACQ